MRTSVAIMAALAFLGLAPFAFSEATAGALRLVMVQEAGCRFCRQWEKDVGAAYPRTPQARLAPLRRVRRGAPEVATFDPVVYTPTFILTNGKNEIGRITGYPGEAYFWEELDLLLAKAR